MAVVVVNPAVANLENGERSGRPLTRWDLIFTTPCYFGLMFLSRMVWIMTCQFFV